jgi:hypothetical protein
MAKKFLVATGVVGLIAVGVWAGPIRILDWGPHRPQVDPNVLADLILKIMNPNTEVRFKAVEELGRLRATEAFSVIVGRLSDKAISDAHGFFSLYPPPNEQFADQRGSLIPPGSRFHITIEPLPSSVLLPFQGEIGNGTPNRIVLERAGGKVHTFIFQTSDRVPIAPDLMKQITIQVQRPNRPPLTYGYAQWSAGSAIPEGTYVASLRTEDYERHSEPLLVTVASPDILVFLFPGGVAYLGQVVHAATGRPYTYPQLRTPTSPPTWSSWIVHKVDRPPMNGPTLTPIARLGW